MHLGFICDIIIDDYNDLYRVYYYAIPYTEMRDFSK